ncbi:MAG: LEA type 2 family protein [Thermococcus sp.]|nr:LEA type 2 family protein [Thermococcus sp.]
MGAIRKILGAVFIVLVIWGGYIAYTLSTASPKVSAEWGAVSEKTTEIKVSMDLQRPLLTPLDVEDLRFLFMDEQVGRLAELDYSPFGTEIKASLELDNEKVVDALLKYLENGERGDFTVVAKPKVLFLSGEFNVSKEIDEKVLDKIHLTAQSQEIAGLSLLKTPELKDTIVRYEGKEGDRAVFITELVLYNPNPYPIPVIKTGYKVWVNGLKLGDGESLKATVIPAGGMVRIPVKTYVLLSNIPKAWEMHVRNNETSTVRAEIFLRLQISIPGFSGTKDVTLKTINQTVKTDLIGEINRALSKA